MVFPYIGNFKYPHGRTYQQQHFKSPIQAPKDRKRQRLRYISRNDRLPLLSLFFSLEATTNFHSVMNDSWAVLPWKYDPGQLKVWWESYFTHENSYLLQWKKSQFYFLHTDKTCENQEKKIDRQLVMTRKGGYDQEGYGQLVMSRNSSRIKASRKTQGRLLLNYRYFFSELSELHRIFFKNDGVYGGWRFFLINFVCLYVAQKTTPLHTCTVVNNGTCAVLRVHTVNWHQRSFIQVFFVSASVLSMDRCYKLFLP